MTEQLSICCKAGIKLTGKNRPNAFACEKCGRIIGTPTTSQSKLLTELIDRVGEYILPPEDLPYDEETYEHGYNQALDDVIKLLKGIKQ